MAPAPAGGDAAAAAARRAVFVGAVSNLSVQYNMQAASLALAFMKHDYPQPGWVKLTLLGAVFAGALVGMTVMGYLGDLIGRRRAMLLTLALVVVGALVTALGSWDEATYAVICAARFVIGMGVGGIYPLAAATAAESEKAAAKDSDGDGGDAVAETAKEADDALVKRVGWAFFWQAPGSMLPYVVGLMLLGLPNTTPDVSSVQFRLVLGLGALPAAIVWWAAYTSTESAAYTKAAADAAAAKSGELTDGATAETEDAVMVVGAPHEGGDGWGGLYARHKPYLATLVGTGGAWLLLDIALYGTNVFTPQILAAIFGENEDNLALCWQSIVVTAMGIPATVATILLMPRWGGRALTAAGFALMALSFGAMAITFGVYPSSGEASSGKFLLFALITFAINFGPNVATYIMPAQFFPTAVRSRYHGFSAACGKVGAVIGSFMFTPIQSASGVAAVMWTQVALCLVGVIVALALLPRLTDHSSSPADDDEGSAVGGGDLRTAKARLLE